MSRHAGNDDDHDRGGDRAHDRAGRPANDRADPRANDRADNRGGDRAEDRGGARADEHADDRVDDRADNRAGERGLAGIERPDLIARPEPVERSGAAQHRAAESGGGLPWDALRPGVNRKPRRKRVVLNDSRNPVTVLRTISELEEQTSVGEVLVRDLVRTQFRMAVGLALLTLAPLAALPLAFYLSPAFAATTLFGVRLPWLLVGVLPFPLLFGVGYWYNRLAERHEKDFVNVVES